MSDIGREGMRQQIEKQHQEELMRLQHEQDMQKLQFQHNLEMQRQQQQQQAAPQGQQRQDAELVHLDAAYPNWRAIVGAPGGLIQGGPDLTKPFRRWLATKSPEFQTLINGTSSPAQVERAITMFLTELQAVPN